MTFIIILIAVLLERFFHWHHLRHWRWFLSYERWLSAQLGALPSALILIIVILPPVVGLSLLQHFLTGWWWGGLKFIISVIILLYCLGPANLWAQTYRCINELNKHEQAGIAHAQATFNFTATDSALAFHQAFVRAIFLASHQRIFTVLFWFVLLGPAGAVLYRLMESLSTQAMAGARLASQMQAVMDWLPIRVETFLFALGGHFTAVLAYWKQGVFKGLSANYQFLSDCGIAALDSVGSKQLTETTVAVQEALALVDRAWLIGLVILAAIVLLM